MAFLKKIGRLGVLAGGLLGGPVGAAAGLLVGGAASAALKGKKKKGPAVPLPQATRDDADVMAQRDDALRLRRGGAADLLLGGGAEPGGAALGRFVLGS